MKYTRLAVVAILLVGLILWLRQCTSTDETPEMQSTLDNLKNQTGNLTQGKTDGAPATTPAPTPKSATGS